jgi:hypothetical protein
MTHPILFCVFCLFTFASVIGTLADDNGAQRFNKFVDSLIYGYTAYVLWGI